MTSRVAHVVFSDGDTAVSPRPGRWACAVRLTARGLRLVHWSSTAEGARRWRVENKRRLRLTRGLRVRWEQRLARPGWPPDTAHVLPGWAQRRLHRAVRAALASPREMAYA